MKESFKDLTHFCEALGIPKSKVKKVLMPAWWVGSKKRVIGYTDWKDTHCCDTTPATFVWVPVYDYDGYFHKKDLKLVK
jgi:hypothetical protein